MPVLALLALASPAAGSTATSRLLEAGHLDTDAWLVELDGADGEANRVVVSETPGAIRFTDTGAPLHAGEGCDQVSEHEALCRPQLSDLTIAVLLGDGDDEAASAGPAVVLLGGPGAAVLTGGPGGDVLDGGRGAD
ncbi:MAG TPA: hypothetical protein VF533_09150, partial [Solirubrobacteraceae bacterium]